MKATLRCIKLATIISFLLAVHSLSLAKNPQTWIEVQSPHFAVDSNASEQDARRVAEQFEMIRAVFLEYYGHTGASDAPITILAAKDEETLRMLLPEFWEKKNSVHPAGVFLGGGDANYVALRLDVSLNQGADVPYEPVYHEYVHYLMRHRRSQLPLWMVEGLAEFYGNTRAEGNKVLVGAPNAGNVRLLQGTVLLPVNALFDVDASSPYYHEENKTSIFYAESWALTHYLITRDWKEKTQRMNDFDALLRNGVDQREAAARTIGDPAGLDTMLQKYIQNSAFYDLKLDRPKIDESGFQARGMSNAESLAVRADFMAHDGHYPQAQAMLEEALKLDPKLGPACESMSLLYLTQRNRAQASKWASQALALNPQSFRANYYTAVTLTESGLHDENTLSKAEASLRTVVKINPAFAQAYDLLAYVLSQPGPTQKLDEAYMATIQAIELEPSNIYYRIRAVDVLEKQGRAEDAILAANFTISRAKTPADHAMAEASLAGAQQFQASQKKMKEQQEAQASSEASSGTASPDRKESANGGHVSSRTEQVAPGVAVTGRNTGGTNLRDGESTSGQMEILSDTMGVDFGPYLNHMLQIVRQNWYNLIPEMARPPVMKQGKVAIEFAILRDGSVAGMKLADSSDDVALDRAAWGSITTSSPFPALPAEFNGQYLALRLYYYYNIDLTQVAVKTEPPETNAVAKPDIISKTEQSGIRISPSGPLNLVAGLSTQQFTAEVGGNVVADVDWAVYGNNCAEVDCGTISATGLYTAPAKVKESLHILVTAKETSTPSNSAFARVTIVPPGSSAYQTQFANPTDQKPTTPTSSAGQGAVGLCNDAHDGGGFAARFPWYVQVVQRKVSENWLKYEVDPRIKTANRVCLNFDIDRSGQPSNLRIVQSSGVPSLDNSAVRAVQRVYNFGPLPAEYEKDKVSVLFWFDYKTAPDNETPIKPTVTVVAPKSN